MKNKKILGLDLGVGSIGWCLINRIENQIQSQEQNEILGIGVRIIPLTTDETTGFTKGNGVTVCQQRTEKRSMRRGNDRYKQRRKMLGQLLDSLGMTFGKELLDLNPMALWQLRADAATGYKLSLAEIGRVIYHINQRRGYKASKGDSENSSSEYLGKLNARAAEAAEAAQTPGQYFAERLKASEYESTSGAHAYSYRIKEEVFPRKNYEQELRQILECQRTHYPDLLTQEVIDKIFDTIFYQRPLRSCKHLVSICEFESKQFVTPDGKTIIAGPRVAPASSPIAEVCRMYEAINNIKLRNPTAKKKRSDSQIQQTPYETSRWEMAEISLTDKERKKAFDVMNLKGELKTKDIALIMGLPQKHGFVFDKSIGKGIRGNATRMALADALADMPDADKLLKFDVEIDTDGRINTDTGEITRRLSSSYLKEPLYQLWHTVYSISDYEELKTALEKKFGITDPETVDRLFRIDFRGRGYSNRSAKFMCELIPYLQEGYMYSEAADMVGIRHSGYMTKEENDKRVLADSIPLLKKGELRQPVVEKILNQMIHLVNEIKATYGDIDEIRIEMARTLKQSKDNRAKESKRINMREQENKRIEQIIANELKLRPSSNKIQKYRMWEESEKCCMYCGKPVDQKEFLMGFNAEKEHVIPRSLIFDDSFSNKVCACRNCNRTKGQLTGYDFMKAQSEDIFLAYVARVERLADIYVKTKGKQGISRTKRDRLLTSRKDIPQDFIERELRQSQYIARKAAEILQPMARNVSYTSGSVTDFFRHVWGYDRILHDLNLARYSEAGQTEMVETEHHGQIHTEEQIPGWTKRMDHRHHAVDALTIAMQRQSHIQRLNNLNTLYDENSRSSIYEEGVKNLEKWAAAQPHPSYAEARDCISRIAVSYKAGKKVATFGKRLKYRKGHKPEVLQEGIIVPRGPLSEETVYGKIKVRIPNVPLKELFSKPDSIINPHIREAVSLRLSRHSFNVKEAVKSTRKEPLTVGGTDSPITQADCWDERIVVKYKIEDIKLKKVDSIVDGAARQAIRQRFKMVGDDDAKFKSSVSENPVYADSAHNLPIRTVRCFTGINPDASIIVRRDGEGRAIGYAKPGSNHHIALYRDSQGALHEVVVPWAHAVLRKQLGLPIVVKDCEAVWNTLTDMADTKEQSFLARFPEPTWQYVVSMEQNEMFVIGYSDDELKELIASNDTRLLFSKLYRVQALTSGIYEFQLHTHTLAEKTLRQIQNGNYLRIQSFGRWEELNPRKVKIDRLGHLALVDKL